MTRPLYGEPWTVRPILTCREGKIGLLPCLFMLLMSSTGCYDPDWRFKITVNGYCPDPNCTEPNKYDCRQVPCPTKSSPLTLSAGPLPSKAHNFLTWVGVVNSDVSDVHVRA